MISLRQQEVESEEVQCDGEADFLSILLKENGRAQLMKESEMLANLLFLLLAGHETSALTMTWCLYALGKVKEISWHFEAKC